MKSCRMADPSGQTGEAILRTMVARNDGLLLGVGAEDMSFMAAFPEPEAGYAAYFADSENYRRLFRALAMSGALEVLYYLHSEAEDRFYSAGAVARQVGIGTGEAEAILAALVEANVLSKRELMLESGLEKVYVRFDEWGILVPFLYLARWMGEEAKCYHLAWGERSRPLLRRSEIPEKKEEESK